MKEGRAAGVWSAALEEDVWVAPQPHANEVLICTKVRGSAGAGLCRQVAISMFGGTTSGVVSQALQFASCLRLPIKPREPLPMGEDGVRCQLVWPAGRWWPVWFGGMPVAFSLVVSRHKDFGAVQYFIEAHIGGPFLNRDGDGRRDLYGSDLRYLRPLLDQSPPSLYEFTGFVVNTMVRCAQAGGFLARGADLGVVDGVVVRDEIGRGYEIDGDVVFDMRLPNFDRRMITLDSAPYFIPLPESAVLKEEELRALVRDERARGRKAS